MLKGRLLITGRDQCLAETKQIFHVGRVHANSGSEHFRRFSGPPEIHQDVTKDV